MKNIPNKMDQSKTGYNYSENIPDKKELRYSIHSSISSSVIVKVATVSLSSVLNFTFATPAILVYIISRWTDAGERAGGVHTSVLTQKLREAALIQVYRE